jgi:cobalt/nickel transport system ATP-binding protein
MAQSIVDVRDLSYRHPDGSRALDGVSLQLTEGESLVLFGPNGSGKTTLLLHLNGTLQGAGEIRVADLPLNKQTIPEIRKRVGIVFQDADEQLFMPTVLEDTMFGPLNLGWPHKQAEEKAILALQKVGIADHLLQKPPFHLSAGEKRRVALAGVLAMEPQILLLDEPTTSLDPPGQKTLLDILRSLPQSKIIATHDINFARALAARAVFLQDGRLVADGEVDEIIQRFGWNLYY